MLLAAIALSRIPFLDAGYGSNFDAWRVARVARNIAQTGEYEASRFPGYPVQEIVCSWLWRFGPIALNALSAAFSVLASFAIWKIGQRLCCRDSILLAAAFAFTPVVFVNSVTAKDCVWAIAFILLAFWAALARRWMISGLLLGVAVGCRITSGAMLLPLAMILAPQESSPARWQKIAIFTGIVLLTSAACYFPVWSRYGFSFLTFYENHVRPDIGTIVARATVDVWGTLGLAGLTSAFAAAFVLRRKKMAASLGESTNPMIQPALWTAMILYVIAYLRLPDQPEYLLPVVPVFLLIAARFIPRRLFQLACVVLLFPAWIDLSRDGPRPGAILADYEGRRKIVSHVTRFIRFTEDVLPGHNVVVVGAWEPMIDVLGPKNALHNDYCRILFSRELAEAQSAGRRIAYTDDLIRAMNFRDAGIDLAQAGGVNLRKLRVAMHL